MASFEGVKHLPDPGGIFETDTQRRVLAHLSTPDDDFGFTLAALTARLDGDPHTPCETEDDVAAVLAELKAEGLALEHKGGIWQQSKDGFAALTGPIANEPPPSGGDEAHAAPIRLDAPTPLHPKPETKAAQIDA